MSFRILILVIAASALAGADLALAQQPPVASATQQSDGSAAPNPESGAALPPRLGDYQVGPGDVLSIQVTGVREFDQSIRVSNSGRIRVPYVGIMFAAGMTTVELEREISSKIQAHELVNEPMVRVQVDQHRARPAYIVGAVTTPGQFVITDELYLLDLISRAGGLAAGAGPTGFVYRGTAAKPTVSARVMVGSTTPDATAPPAEDELPVEPSSEGQVISIDLEALREGTRPELNIPLQGGDVVYVPVRQARTFYIIGDVKLPGAYTMPRRGDVSAVQAIIYAGGPLLTAKNGSAFLMRHDENGERQAFPIDFNDIIKGKKPDIAVQADDIIFIPNSAVKTIGVGLLNLVPRLLQQFLIF